MVYRLVTSTYNTKELLLRLTRLVCQVLKASSSDVYLLDPQKKKLIFIAIFNGHINILLDKKSDLADAPAEEISVVFGDTIVKDRVIGLPLVADDNLGAIFIRRKKNEPSFKEFDKEVLSVIAEQSVLAIKNLQLYENQQRIILSSIKSISRFFKVQAHSPLLHAPAYFKIVKALAEKLRMPAGDVECLRYASVLRDAGVMDVPFEILSKTSSLTSDEFKVIREHPARNAELIRPVEFLRPVLPIILYHREKYDGTGYPSGLKKEQIPLGARVMAVADAFEAMITDRPYRVALSTENAIEELKRNSGTQFDPKIVHAFCELAKQKNFRKYLSLIKK